jgi:hypothetical protein
MHQNYLLYGCSIFQKKAHIKVHVVKAKYYNWHGF